MPQVDLKYSNVLIIDIQELFTEVEQVINELDSSAGVCKSRAYPTSDYLHDNVLLHIKLLKKPQRDEAFMQKCLKRIEEILRSYLPHSCYYAVEIDSTSPYYLTSRIEA